MRPLLLFRTNLVFSLNRELFLTEKMPILFDKTWLPYPYRETSKPLLRALFSTLGAIGEGIELLLVSANVEDSIHQNQKYFQKKFHVTQNVCIFVTQNVWHENQKRVKIHLLRAEISTLFFLLLAELVLYQEHIKLIL